MNKNNLQHTKKQQYKKMVEKASPNSKIWQGIWRAFVVGGIICTIGQAVNTFATDVLMMFQDDAGSFTSLVMIFLGATLTGLGVYDKIGKFAGAGSIVPITGFANSVVAPAMEFKREGYIMGVGAKLFTLAGPVIVYGTVASVVYGIIYWITTLF